MTIYGLALQGDTLGRASYCSGKVYSLRRYLLRAFNLIYFVAEVVAHMWAGGLVGLRL